MFRSPAHSILTPAFPPSRNAHALANAAATATPARLAAAAPLVAAALWAAAALLASGCSRTAGPRGPASEPQADARGQTPPNGSLSTPTGAEEPAESNFAGLEQRAFARIVSLAPNLTEMVFFAGAGHTLVARTEFCNFPPQALSLPAVQGGATPDLEQVLSFDPDLVVVLQSGAARLPLEDLASSGVAVYWTRVETTSDVIRTVRELGRLAGTRNVSNPAADRIEADIAGFAASRSLKRILVVHGHRPLVAAGPGSWGDQLLLLAGFRNALDSSYSRYPVLDIEQILECEPDVVLDTEFSQSGTNLDAFWAQFAPDRARPPFQVVYLTADLVLRPGPRMVDAANLLRSSVSPTPKATAGGQP